ncbi:MAG: hypothetical protein AAF821_22405 [Cyanobacteria bacterium P01_D01_bin.156]
MISHLAVSNIRNKVSKSYSILLGYFTKALPKQRFQPINRRADVHLKIQSNALLHDRGRYFYILIKTLSLHFSQVSLVHRFNLLDYYKIGFYGRAIYKIKNLQFDRKSSHDRHNKILIYDQPLSQKQLSGWKKCIRIESDISLSKPNNDQWALIPYSMNPRIYDVTDKAELNSLRHSKRKIRLFFTGNINPNIYSGRGFWEKSGFDLMPRRQVISAIKKTFPERISWIENLDDWTSTITTDLKNKIVLGNRKRFSIPPEMWLSSLASCDFFICAPGIDMPLCHNAVEAMAVGTIPLINYSNWFCPNLRDLHNCVAFENEEDLHEKVNLILSMPEEQIMEMRKNVIDYYERHLNLDAFYQQLIDSQHQAMTLFMNTGNRNILQKITSQSVIWG